MEWIDIEPTAEEHLCRIAYFEIQKQTKTGPVPFRIAVREFLDPPDPAMKFVATADKETNQRIAPYTPTGWGDTQGLALWECLQAIRKFPYEPPELD